MVHSTPSDTPHDVRLYETGNAAYCVRIYSTLQDVLHEGDPITLTAVVTGYEGEVDLQWQMADGGLWRDVSGATGVTYSFLATGATVNLSWRVSVRPRHTT